jgi:hypothetical protein
MELKCEAIACTPSQIRNLFVAYAVSGFLAGSFVGLLGAGAEYSLREWEVRQWKHENCRSTKCGPPVAPEIANIITPYSIAGSVA